MVILHSKLLVYRRVNPIISHYIPINLHSCWLNPINRHKLPFSKTPCGCVNYLFFYWGITPLSRWHPPGQVLRSRRPSPLPATDAVCVCSYVESCMLHCISIIYIYICVYEDIYIYTIYIYVCVCIHMYIHIVCIYYIYIYICVYV